MSVVTSSSVCNETLKVEKQLKAKRKLKNS